MHQSDGTSRTILRLQAHIMYVFERQRSAGSSHDQVAVTPGFGAAGCFKQQVYGFLSTCTVASSAVSRRSN